MKVNVFKTQCIPGTIVTINTEDGEKGKVIKQSSNHSEALVQTPSGIGWYKWYELEMKERL